MRLVLALMLVPSLAFADTALEKVDTEKSPLQISAPAGWAVHIEAPQHPDLSTIASISPDCSGGPDISVAIQLDQKMTKPAQLLNDQYKGKKSTKSHGVECIADAGHTEVMCAGTVKGVKGIVSAYFATIGDAPYKRFGDPMDFTARVLASVAWKTGKLADLAEWKRDATDAAKSACK